MMLLSIQSIMLIIRDAYGVAGKLVVCIPRSRFRGVVGKFMERRSEHLSGSGGGDYFSKRSDLVLATLVGDMEKLFLSESYEV